MRYLILLFYFISLSVFAGESNKSSHDHHDHSSHDHKGDQTFVDGQKLNVDQKIFTGKQNLKPLNLQ